MRPAFSSLRSVAVAAFLLAVFLAQLFVAAAMKSPSWDEPGDIASGVAYVQLGSLAVNPQHPPLLKALSGLSLTLSGARWPGVPHANDLLRGDDRWQWEIGNLILIQSGLDRALMWARLPMMLVGTLGGLLIYLWGRGLAGELAALCALFLYVLDPTIVGHAFQVTLDVGLGAFTLLFVYCLWNYVRSAGKPWLLASGITLGMALCTKFSGTVLVPIAAILLLAGTYRARVDRQWIVSSALSLAWIYGIAAAVVIAIYRFHGPGTYLAGMSKVNADHVANYAAYLAGNMAPSFTNYFAAAYLLKEPLAAILFAIAGLFFLLRSGDSSTRDKWFLLLPPVVLFGVHVWKADDLGIRYIIPCLPFAHLLGGIALAKLLRAPKPLLRFAAAALCVWVAVAAAAIFPDGLSYFNESACLLDDPAKLGLDGGTRCGIAWLDDSNVDWGQGLKQLQVWLAENAKGRTAKLLYFGSFPPAAYHLPVEPVGDAQLWFRPPPGLWVVSAHSVAANSALVRLNYVRGDGWMLRTPPLAIVGHCLYVYEIPGG
jgi:Dolichyl-phosphate-mannose-protein mannosyltransferase